MAPWRHGETEEARKPRRQAYERRPWTPARENRAIEWHDRLLPQITGEEMSRACCYPLGLRWIRKVSPFPWAEMWKLRDEKLRLLLTKALGGTLPPELRAIVLDELIQLPGTQSLELVDLKGAQSIVEQALPLLMERLSLGS